jgi:hypothetical protein
MFWHGNQVITHIRECCGDSNRYTPCKGKLDNTTYARSLGPYVWQPFAKSIRGQIHSSTHWMKSWFLGDRPTLPSSWATSLSLRQPPWSSGYNSTKQLHKLGAINSACVSTVQCLFHRVQHDVVLNRHRRGLLPRSLGYLLIHSPPSHSVILHLQFFSFPTHLSN